MPNRSASWFEDGAIIEEETGLVNVNADTTIVALPLLAEALTV